MKKIQALVVLICLLATTCQSFSQAIDKQGINAVVFKVATLIKEKYVFESKGFLIADAILKKHKQANFANIASWQALADSLTRTVQASGNDGHLFVRNDPKTVNELVDAEKETAVSQEHSAGEDPFFYGTAATARNFGFDEVKVLKENIGYIKLSQINISAKSLPTLYAAMRFVAHTKALIIDLRDNGGGGSDIGSVLPSFFLRPGIPLLEFKSRTGQMHTEKTVGWLTEPKYNKPVYIIINKGTASAAEEFAFCMQAQKRAAIIGQPSAGAANMSSWYVINDHLFISISTAAPTLPGTNDSWERNGIKPDYIVDEGKEIGFIMSRIN